MKDKKQREAQALARTNFNSSRLIRFLADLVIVDGTDAKHAFAQRLGHWVSFTDANTLYTALEPNRVRASVQPSATYIAVYGEFSRGRTALMDSINQSCSPLLGAARIKFPIPTADTPPEIAITYPPFQRFYLALQREMDAKVGPLRATVREALTAASPALRQLAALDAALDQILSDRERRLFSTVPVLLKKRFHQLLNAHQQTLLGEGRTDDPATWMQPGAWLAGFRDELRGVLLAELDVRLQPVIGLTEAFSNEVNGQT